MTTLIVIAKECIPGRVKTRLHPPYSLADAARIAQACIDDTLHKLAGLPATRRILYFDGTTAPAAARGWEIVPQSTGGLDERLAHIFDLCDGPTVLVGMDTPQLEAAVLAPLMQPWPASTDVWFGPSTDGGFWALGMRDPRGDLIRGVPMSESFTGAVQRERLVAAGLHIAELPALTDIDTAADLAGAALNAPRLAATLRTLANPRHTELPESIGVPA